MSAPVTMVTRRLSLMAQMSASPAGCWSPSGHLCYDMRAYVDARTPKVDLHLVQPEPARPKLIVEGVSKRFLSSRARVEALEDVSLSVADGEFVCLVGPSGCGKSTLLDIMAGLTKPDRGRVIVDGQTGPGPGPRDLASGSIAVGTGITGIVVRCSSCSEVSHVAPPDRSPSPAHGG